MDDPDEYTISERLTNEARARVDAAIAVAMQRESELSAYDADDVAELYRRAR
jgi:hypothetical protein